LYLLDYIIEPYFIDVARVNQRTFEVTYNTICAEIENMNLKHELLKAQVCAWKDDIFFGYISSTKDSFFIQKLNPDYCQISSIVDGCYCFSFDFSYFNGKPETIFLEYPLEFQSLYKQYQADISKKWIELNPDYTICIKINEDVSYPLIPFCGVFEALYDIEDYKSLKKAKTAIGNYKMIAMIMPLAKEGQIGTNPYLVDPDEITKYYNFMASIMPDEVGLLLSPTDLKEFSFDKDTADSDKVSESTSQFWDSAGVSELLMSGKNATGMSLAKSVTTDEALSLGVIRQIERNINRLIKKFNADTYKFRYKILPTTIFNWMEVYDKYKEASNFGYPTKLMAASALGLSQASVKNMLYLENDILGLPTSMIPTQSSATSNSEELAGRPTTSNDKKAENSSASLENEENAKKNFDREINVDLDEVIN
jgi:hypothetical protein